MMQVLNFRPYSLQQRHYAMSTRRNASHVMRNCIVPKKERCAPDEERRIAKSPDVQIKLSEAIKTYF